MTHDELAVCCQKIRMVVSDIDGVLTDGGMYYGEDGNELKKFNVRDGVGVALLKAAGIQVGLITGEKGKLIERRAAKIGTDFLFTGVKNKIVCLEEYANQHCIDIHEVAYLGDEINDYCLIGKVGLFLTVSDANEIIRQKADYAMDVQGGQGALRQAALLILKSQNNLETALQNYLNQNKES